MGKEECCPLRRRRCGSLPGSDLVGSQQHVPTCRVPGYGMIRLDPRRPRHFTTYHPLNRRISTTDFLEGCLSLSSTSNISTFWLGVEAHQEEGWRHDHVPVFGRPRTCLFHCFYFVGAAIGVHWGRPASGFGFFSLAFRLGFWGGRGAMQLCGSFEGLSVAFLPSVAGLQWRFSPASRTTQCGTGWKEVVWCVHTKVPREEGGHEEARQRLQHTMCTYGCRTLDHDGLGKGMKAWFILPHGLCATGS